MRKLLTIFCLCSVMLSSSEALTRDITILGGGAISCGKILELKEGEMSEIIQTVATAWAQGWFSSLNANLRIFDAAINTINENQIIEKMGKNFKMIVIELDPDAIWHGILKNCGEAPTMDLRYVVGEIQRKQWGGAK